MWPLARKVWLILKESASKGVKFYPTEDCAQIASLKEVDVVVLAMRGTRCFDAVFRGPARRQDSGPC